MLIIGCDYHPGFQQIAFVDTETGEVSERRLAHREEAEQFYCKLSEQGLKARVGMEASGHSRWFESQGTKSAAVAQSILPPRHAPRTKDRQSGNGAKAGGASVLDVAPRLGLRPAAKARFAGSKTLLSYCSDRGFDSIA
jgi:hypothetical protein